MITKRKLTMVLAATTAALSGSGAALSGCTSWDDTPSYPPATPTVSGSPSPHPEGVIVLPESYVDLRSVCDHGNRVYVAERSGVIDMLVIPADPSCKESPQ